MCKKKLIQIERRFASLALKLIAFTVASVLSIGTELLEDQGSIRGRAAIFLFDYVNIDSRIHVNPVEEHSCEMLRCPNRAPSHGNSVFVNTGTDSRKVTSYNPQNDIDISITHHRILTKDRTHDAFRPRTGVTYNLSNTFSAAPLPRGRVCFSRVLIINVGTRGGEVCNGPALQPGMSRLQFPIRSLRFFIDLILPTAIWSPVRLSLYHKLIQRISWGIKAAGV